VARDSSWLWFGFVELWYYPHDADDTQPVFHIFGAPALPQWDTPNVTPPLPIDPAPDPQLHNA
jgi:hypothetical protein